MTRKDCIVAALDHRETGRVPYDQSSRSSAIELDAYVDLKKQLGYDGPSACYLRSHAELEVPVMERLGIDTRFIRSIPSSAWRKGGPGAADDVFVDSWEVPWRRRSGSPYYELDASPLEFMEPDEVLALDWPPLVSEDMIADLKAQVRLWGGRGYALFCDHVGAGIFERAWYLRGFERTLTDLALEKEWSRKYFGKILERQIETYAKIIDATGDSILGFLVTDDLATQDSQMMSRGMYRETLFPFHRELLGYIRSRGPKVIFHSCGAVRPFIPDLLDAGVEILHPIQRSAAGMSPEGIKREFGAELAIWGGGCDTAFLQTANPSEIRDDVRRTLDTLSPGGGFVYTTTHCIQPGTPPGNILAMADALAEWNGASGFRSEL
jgi:uroporphyrinogen decarboxylase